MSAVSNSAIRNDHWTIIDGLGFAPTGDQLAKLIMLADPPFAVGVTGKWGSGKTSLMRYAMARLGGEPISSQHVGTTEPGIAEIADDLCDQWTVLQNGADEFLTEYACPRLPVAAAPETETEAANPEVRSVWFSPWQYQSDPNPLIPLLHEIRKQISVWAKARREAGKLISTAVEAGIESLGGLIGTAFGLGKGLEKIPGAARKTAERIERERFDTPTDAQRFHLQFERAVDLVLGGNTKGTNDRLVIFIDDLDRCGDEQVLQVLQMIKLYLSTRRCVFVLGIDRDAVEKAVGSVWNGKSSKDAREYIEKLFQAMVYVPVSQNYREFISRQLEDSGCPAEEDLVPLLADILEPNPRKVKNFLNSLVATWRTTETDGFTCCQFALVHYLRTYHPEVHLLAAQKGGIDALRQVMADDVQKDYVQLYMHRCFAHLSPNPSGKDHTDEDPNDPERALAGLADHLAAYEGQQRFKALFGAHFDTDKLPSDEALARLFGRVTKKAEDEA